MAWEIPYEELQDAVEIGKGSSGVVFRAKWRQGFVAGNNLW
jgi:predicted Ser/Thr protein kinase